MDKEKTSKIAERLRAISSRSGEVARDVLRRMVNATMAAQIAESPAIMTASGQKIEKDGSVSFDNAEDPGVIKLRNNLPKIGTAGILGSTYGVLGPSGIARYALEGIDYTSPSHWVAKGAAKLGLGASQAYDLGLVSDMVASAYPGFRKSVNGLKNMYHGIGDSDAVSEGAKEALIGLGGFGLGHLVGWGWNAAANGIRKAKNLARIDDLKTLGEYDDIVSNLRRYHSGHALDRPGVGKLDNVRVEIAPSMAGGTADADYSGWSDIIRINPDAKHLQLGREYTNALLAHEGTHAAFNRMPVSSQVSVDGRDYFMANSANPDVAPVAHLFQRNDPKGVGTWMASPEEYVSEMGFLRQLTGQNKRFGDLSPFYKNRFNTYLSNRFDFTPKESLQVIGALGKKYPGGGKFFRTNLQNESPLMYQPMMPINYPIEAPLRFRPEPDLGDYRAPESTGMIVNYPVTAPGAYPVTVVKDTPAPVAVKVPAENLFSDEMIARRALKQRYAESAFNDKAKSHAGAQGAWQIMPITLKDYLGRGRGKAGDLNDPEYNRKVRDWVMGIIPRDLKEFWSENDSDRAKLAKLYAAYNWGAGNLRGFLRKKRDAGIDISNPDNWVNDLNPETRRYVKYLAFDEDIPDSTVYTNAAFEKAAADRGYADGGKIHIKPEIFNGKVYYRDGGILEGDFDVDDISDEELYELDRLGYDVDIL